MSTSCLPLAILWNVLPNHIKQRGAHGAAQVQLQAFALPLLVPEVMWSMLQDSFTMEVENGTDQPPTKALVFRRHRMEEFVFTEVRAVSLPSNQTVSDVSGFVSLGTTHSLMTIYLDGGKQETWCHDHGTGEVNYYTNWNCFYDNLPLFSQQSSFGLRPPLPW